MHSGCLLLKWSTLSSNCLIKSVENCAVIVGKAAFFTHRHARTCFGDVSVRLSVGLSVHPSIHPYAHLSVCPRVKNSEIGKEFHLQNVKSQKLIFGCRPT